MGFGESDWIRSIGFGGSDWIQSIGFGSTDCVGFQGLLCLGDSHSRDFRIRPRPDFPMSETCALKVEHSGDLNTVTI